MITEKIKIIKVRKSNLTLPIYRATVRAESRRELNVKTGTKKEEPTIQRVGIDESMTTWKAKLIPWMIL